MVQHLTVARVAEGLGVAWDTVNSAVLAEGRRVLIDDDNRFAGVKVVGVDKHVWRHTRRGEKYVTVIIDLTEDVLAHFDRPGTSNGPTEAIDGRLEHLRGSALGFRNLTNHIARSLLETGGFRPQLHPRLGWDRYRPLGGRAHRKPGDAIRCCGRTPSRALAASATARGR
ncbi:hypothetical protein BJZ21_003616 [Nocardioides panaciterrulae]|uniref:Transposase IS204/IS1001/IS1096/IS1165 DDE domain-containing protein n=1 Tax=Nocardioides panaciterrulae TaxID=661492 RepID=A0A7Y9E9D9_9ACTN|nr:hypothetical protein [Nocardioides panaciterrulae]